MGRCSSRRSTPASAPAPSCSPTAASSIQRWRSTRRSEPSAERSGTRSSTATAASDESWTSRSDLAVDDLVFAFHPHQDRFVARASDLVRLPPIDARLATLLPFVETALQLTLDAGPMLEETVVVSGLGVVGLLTAMLLQRGGAHVIAVEPRRWRRELAAELGTAAVHPDAVDEALAAAGRPRRCGPPRRGVRQPAGAGRRSAAAGLRRHGAGRLVVRASGRGAPARRPLPPPAPHDPQLPGLDHPGSAVVALGPDASAGCRHPAVGCAPPRTAGDSHGPPRRRRRGLRHARRRRRKA